jgi:hypothetical protein
VGAEHGPGLDRVDGLGLADARDAPVGVADQQRAGPPRQAFPASLTGRASLICLARTRASTRWIRHQWSIEAVPATSMEHPCCFGWPLRGGAAVRHRDCSFERGPGGCRDPELGRAAQEDLAVPAHRVRPVRVAVRVAPRPGLAGHREFLLELLVVRAQLGVAHRPVGAHPVPAPRGEVTRVEPRGVARVVDHRAADAAPGVVRAHRHRVGSRDDPRVGPVQVVRARLVAHPVGVRVPERAGVQGRYPPPGPGQPLQQDRAARAAAHDDQVSSDPVKNFTAAGGPTLARTASAVTGSQCLIWFSGSKTGNRLGPPLTSPAGGSPRAVPSRPPW